MVTALGFKELRYSRLNCCQGHLESQKRLYALELSNVFFRRLEANLNIILEETTYKKSNLLEKIPFKVTIFG